MHVSYSVKNMNLFEASLGGIMALGSFPAGAHGENLILWVCCISTLQRKWGSHASYFRLPPLLSRLQHMFTVMLICQFHVK